MGKRAVRRKLQTIKLTLRQKVIGLIAIVGTILWWVGEQYAGSVVGNYVSDIFSRFLVSVFGWGKEHPGQISMIIFFLTFSYLVGQIIRDTRTVKEIPVTIHTPHPRSSNGVVQLTNHIGDDLFNCTLDVESVDDNYKWPRK